MLNIGKSIILKAGIVLREEDEGAFLFDPDTGRICYLNDLGVSIWKSCNRQKSPAELIREITLDYPEISGQTIEKDCIGFLEEIGRLGFIQDAEQEQG
jgi:hypothetical protein